MRNLLSTSKPARENSADEDGQDSKKAELDLKIRLRKAKMKILDLDSEMDAPI